jgi:hypothetical protein
MKGLPYLVVSKMPDNMHFEIRIKSLVEWGYRDQGVR